jgi:hypothetical protein
MLPSKKMMLAVLLSRRLIVAVAALGIGLAVAGCGRTTTSLSAGASSSSEAVAETSSVFASTGTATAGPAATLAPSPSARVGGSTSPTTAPPPSSSISGSGAYGYVTAGPTCPVERPDQPCPPHPVAGQVNAQDASGHTVATTRTDQAGRYSLSLASGTYTLVAVTGTTYPRCQPTSVTVHSGGPTRADISCDTGIR